jgi:hypothetical protein
MVFILIITCAVRRATENADWLATKQFQSDMQFKSAEEILRDFPTAAGKKGKMP